MLKIHQKINNIIKTTAKLTNFCQLLMDMILLEEFAIGMKNFRFVYHCQKKKYMNVSTGTNR